MNRPLTPAGRALACAAALLLALASGACHSPLPPPTIPAGENPQRWQEAIDKFTAADAESPPPSGAVVFTGSSSIRLWDSLAEDMAPVPVLNRGFGGSRLFDACYWSKQLVDRYEPRVCVVFSGTNDIAGDHPKTAAQVRDLFRLLVRRLWHDAPELPIVFIAITPTPSRQEHLAIVQDANLLIRSDCARYDQLTFVDPTPDLTNAAGLPEPRFFRDDRLHLNDEGYAVWARHIRPVVERLYGEVQARERQDG